MTVWEMGWQIFLGLCAGTVVAAGLFTFISTLGIVTRLSQVTRTAGFIHWYENSFIAGGIIGNLLWIYRPQVLFGGTGLLFLGLFGGIFTWCLIGAIAEILNAFPIFFRRLDLKSGTALVVAALAVGKLLGVVFQYFL